MENLLRKRREELKLTQFQMANKIGGVTPSSIAAWESERVVPPLSRVPGIAKGYELTEAQVEKEIVAIGRRMRQELATA